MMYNAPFIKPIWNSTTIMAKKAAKVATEAEARAQSIEEMTAAFLKSGGEITQIPNGVSGQTSLSGPKHITIEKKSTS